VAFFANDVAIEIKSDEQLLEWFELNIESGIMCVDAEIKDFDGPLQFSPSKRRCHPKVRQKLIEIATTPCPPTQNERATNGRAKNDPTTNEKATKFKYYHGCYSPDRKVKSSVGISCCSGWSQYAISSGLWCYRDSV
jgi:hypothetical protein